jgi:hypothetical protein
MPELNDCYVLAPARSSSLALKFLDHFVPRREPAFEPADPSEVLGFSAVIGVDHVLQQLEAESTKAYSLYFHNRDACDPLHAAVIFNEDGSLFLMLSVAASEGAGAANHWLQELQLFSGAEIGYWGCEEEPTLGALEFEARAKRV